MIDDIINKSNSQKSYDVEAYKKRKREQKVSAYKMIDEALEELKDNPNAVKNYLDMQSNFDNYSPRNVLLINKQCPNATQLKSRKDWVEIKASFKNSKPNIITILEPSDPYEVDGKTIILYNAKDMIDISDTNLKPFVKSYDNKLVLQALLHECPVAVKVVDDLESGNLCECNTDDKVLYVSRNEVNEEYIKEVATELAKINLYEVNEEIDIDKADCIGYMICKKYGIEANTNSLEKISSKFSNMEKQDIANYLTSMKEVLQDMNNHIGQYLDDKKKESRNKEQER